MALIGGIEQDIGLVANYHIIESYQWVKGIHRYGWAEGLGINVTVSSYIDKAARLANKKPLVLNKILLPVAGSISLTLSDIYNTLIQEEAYKTLTSDEV